MKENLRKLIFSMCLFLFILISDTTSLHVEMASALQNQDSHLIERISNDFTKKFCNSIGFGLSKESAMNFSFSENKKTFKKRNTTQNINKELLANKIATSVIDSCGYQLDLYGDKDIEGFASYYLSIDQENP